MVYSLICRCHRVRSGAKRATRTAVLLTQGWFGSTLANSESLQEGLESASRELIYGNHSTAAEQFEALRQVDDPTKTALWTQSTFGLALAMHHRSPATPQAIARAEGLYRELVEHEQSSLWAARSELALGRLAEVRDFAGDVPDLDLAQAHYQRVFEGWADHAIAHEAALRYADTYVQRFEIPGSVDQGLLFLEDWLAQRPSVPTADRSLIAEYLGKVHADFGRPAIAVLWLVEADECGLTDPTSVGLLYWRIASLAEKAEQVPIAVQYYRKLIQEAPRSGKGFEAQLALRRLQSSHPDLNIDVPSIDLYGEGHRPNPMSDASTDTHTESRPRSDAP